MKMELIIIVRSVGQSNKMGNITQQQFDECFIKALIGVITLTLIILPFALKSLEWFLISVNR